MTSDNQKRNMVNRLIKLRRQIDKMDALIEYMGDSLLYSNASQEIIEMRNEFLRMSEMIYLWAKSIGWDIQRDIDGTPRSSSFEDHGKMISFPASLDYIGHDTWKLHLPLLTPIRIKDKKPGDGKFIWYLTRDLLNEHHAKTLRCRGDNKIRRLEKPLIIFEYHMPTSKRKFDFDNTDSKSVIDAMHGSFFGDDDAFSIMTLYMAVDDKDEFTDVYITQQTGSILLNIRDILTPEI